jgi:SAM-dependent methyltransferase
MNQDRRRRWNHRHRSDDTIGAPSPFVAHALDILTEQATAAPPPSRRALDVACGRGRHALLLADHGYDVDAVDYALPALMTLRHAAAARSLTIHCLATDVTTWPLPSAHYALVLVVDFLERPLLDALRSAVAPGGALLYETYRRDECVGATQALHPDFLLTPGELATVCRGWRVLARHEDTATHNGNVVARAGILAQRPLASSPTAAH